MKIVLKSIIVCLTLLFVDFDGYSQGTDREISKSATKLALRISEKIENSISNLKENLTERVSGKTGFIAYNKWNYKQPERDYTVSNTFSIVDFRFVGSGRDKFALLATLKTEVTGSLSSLCLSRYSSVDNLIHFDVDIDKDSGLVTIKSKKPYVNALSVNFCNFIPAGSDFENAHEAFRRRAMQRIKRMLQQVQKKIDSQEELTTLELTHFKKDKKLFEASFKTALNKQLSGTALSTSEELMTRLFGNN